MQSSRLLCRREGLPSTLPSPQPIDHPSLPVLPALPAAAEEIEEESEEEEQQDKGKTTRRRARRD